MMTLRKAQRQIEDNAKTVLNAYTHYLRVCAFVADGMSHGPVAERDYIDSEREVFEATHRRFVEVANELAERYPVIKETATVREAYKCARVMWRPSPYNNPHEK